MKHIKTFESFVNESKEAPGIFVLYGKENKWLYIEPQDVPAYKKGETVYGSDEDGSEFEVDKKNSDIIKEAKDLSYWKDYDKDSTGQSPDWMSKEAKTTSEVVALVDKCIKHWNQEVEEKGNEIPKSSEKHIGDLAMQYFKQFKTINGHIIDAMIMQES